MSEQGFRFSDGGRAAAGFKGQPRDCATRAIAIAVQMPYRDVYELVNEFGGRERPSKRRKGKSSARMGVHSHTMRRIMDRLGWTWTPTMHIGSGAKVHLTPSELPSGRIIVSLSKHYAAVIDGVIHDSHDPRRPLREHQSGQCAPGYCVCEPIVRETRCVYGYWSAP